MSLLGSLTGSWLLRRSIDNGVSMSGTATIVSLDDGRFAYHERGWLRLPGGQEIDAERRHLFDERDDGFSVFFAESPPRLFHRVVLDRSGSSFVGEGSHLCSEDRYDSRYRFDGDNSFTIEHAVAGPRKRYKIQTRYSRKI
jgi:Family of unknown function (DUF6314)